MASRKRDLRVRIVVRSGRDVETAWFEPIAQGKRTLYRLDNILYFRSTPALGDLVEAAPSARDDGKLAFRRIVRRGGRYTMIIDYPRKVDFAKLCRFFQRGHGVASEGAWALR
jgi:hypothetical protein